MKKYTTVGDFLNNLSTEQKDQVLLLRECILGTDSALIENIKWNAPNYECKGVDRITFNVFNKEGKVKIILHKGAKVKEDKKADPILNDDMRLIQWNSNIRGTLAFNGLHDIKEKYPSLQVIFKKWLEL